MRMKLLDKGDRVDMRTRTDDVAYGLSESGAVVFESMILQYFLECLPEEYLMEKKSVCLQGTTWK